MKEPSSSYEFSVTDYTPTGDYSFLDILGPNVFIYYSLIETIEPYKLINLYRFIYLRIRKINRKYQKIPEMKLIKNSLSHQKLNELLSEYIHSDKLLATILLQSLYHYKHPKYIKKQLIS
jgi:hypothetical protein